MKNLCEEKPGRQLHRSFLALLLVAGLPLVAQSSETIQALEVVGASKQTPATILYKAGLKTGDDLRSVDLTAVMERLWESGAFDDIKFEVADVEGGKKLTILVVERPVVKEVDYRGGSSIGLSGIKDKVKDMNLAIGTDKVYDPEAARKVKAMIVEKCAEKGYRNPVVDVDLEPIGPGLVRLVFDIKEGGKVKVYRVVFKGNKVISSSKLRKAMKTTRKHWMLSWIG
ncbi:MAG TPA: POTRA domain-containing protein, partial [Holophaga sp.]|nr:POTRA domain-containing protein [Holophaga sp.]